MRKNILGKHNPSKRANITKKRRIRRMWGNSVTGKERRRERERSGRGIGQAKAKAKAKGMLLLTRGLLMEFFKATTVAENTEDV
jgi:hypothetical protein